MYVQLTLQNRSGQKLMVLFPRSRFLYLDAIASFHARTLQSNPECHARKTATFVATVIQKTATKLGA